MVAAFMRGSASVLLIAFLVAALAPGAAAQPADEAVRAAIVVVAAVSPDGKACTAATAFHVGRGRFYTNAHVVGLLKRSEREGCTQWAILQARETRIPDHLLGFVRAACVDPRYKETPDETVAPFDVAVLEIAELAPGQRLPPALALESRLPRVGESVRIIGFPVSKEPVRFDIRGVISAVLPAVFLVDNRTAGAIAGVSGSPVFDAGGRVIGIVFGVNVGLRRSAAVPMSTALARCHP